MKWKGALLDLLFPPRCPFCQALLWDGETELCTPCRSRLPWLEGEQAEQQGEFFSQCVSPLWYRGMVRESIHRYKFAGRRWYAGVYGGLMAQCVQAHLGGQFDAITWVPLSRRRLRKRGYDQAALLAGRIARELGMQAAPLLRKGVDTRAQSGLTQDSARRANVLGAYEMCPNLVVSGWRVLLADDVVTTGSTLSECARILKSAGAAEVVCVTLARARGENPDRERRKMAK